MNAYRLIYSFVESMVIDNHLRDIEFRFAVGPMNLWKSSTLPPDNALLVRCKNCVRLRVERNSAMALHKHPLDWNDQAQDGRKEVIGILFEEAASCSSDKLTIPPGQSLKRLVIETMDPVFDMVCEAIEVCENSPDRKRVVAVELELAVSTTSN